MKAPEAINQVHAIALHEWAHCEICSHYGIHSIPKVLKPEERYPETCKNDSVIAGTCTRAVYQKKEITPFQQAVLGWAGVIMELIAGVEKPTLEITLPLNAKNLKDCFHQAMVGFEKISVSDQISICRYKKSYWSSFRRGYHLLRRSRTKIMERAAVMSRAGEKQTLLETPVPAISEADAIKFRAELLKTFLAAMSQSNPDRPRLQKMLECLARGEWPPNKTAGETTQILGK
jgi:hypothetical protein